MTIEKISGAVSPIEETEKINEVIDGVNAAATAADLANYTTKAELNNKFQVVSSLPAEPDADTFYFIPE